MQGKLGRRIFSVTDCGFYLHDGTRGWHLCGLPVYENPEIKSRIGYIPDDLGVLGGGTIRELAAFYRMMYPRFDVARFDALREVFRLDERTPLRRFSKGMQKHAAFWLTLCIRPDYLVLDEPVDGLDPVMRR